MRFFAIGNNGTVIEYTSEKLAQKAGIVLVWIDSHPNHTILCPLYGINLTAPQKISINYLVDMFAEMILKHHNN